ncbi:SusC/RagA family TonB-linked outer membrane protein [Empedobacter falsenii]|uniref:SusC/RagA family TonB-linked outer membrane protein n=1 Tax=Empedobacter falsenii TaxID=343874 RepID=UPI0025786220|nr:SusC/RagA family TonB-linked outer membrane protein [Empedobacter falsenii]MDM1546551.1 SusC/RagA family TonB-linked outer membrane protein [Empedobacter falsenii]
MRRNLKNLFVLGGLLLGASLYAQEKTVTGTVTDSDGLPVADAVVKTTSGKEAYTDENGVFSIEAKQGDLVTVEAMGLPTQSFAVGTGSEYKVTLKPSETVELEGAVVTALGITRDKKSLGYASQEVKGDLLTNSRSSNPLAALSGNVAGAQISTPSGNIGGSARITLRGISSITGENRPLIVIDGVPMDNSNYNTTNTQRGAGGRDYGDASFDINPDDIETMSVLKGGPATALYGSRAGNGVILITTKRGKKGRDEITLNTGISLESVSIIPKLQRLYGGGAGPNFSQQTINGKTYNLVGYTTDESWGAKYDPNKMVLAWDAFDPDVKSRYLVETPWVAPKNDVKSFFNTGITHTNSIAFAKSYENTTARLSLSNVKQTGIVPNTELERTSVGLTVDTKFNDKFSASANMNYVVSDAFNRPEIGYGDNSVAQKMWQFGQRQLDYEQLKNYKTLSGEQKTWNRSAWNDPTPKYSDNPYWIVYENTSNDKRNRVYGNTELKYDILPGLYAVGKVMFDHYDLKVQERVAEGSAAASSYREERRDLTETNYEGRIHYNKKWDRFSINAFAGVNRRDFKSSEMIGQTNGKLIVKDLYNLGNSTEPATVSNAMRHKRINSVFGGASFGFADAFFIDLGVRNDWSSTLPSDDNSFFYPSVTASLVFSELIKQDWLTFGKIRGGWSQSGNDTDPYRLRDTYLNNAYGSIAFGGEPYFMMNTTKNNQYLKPETKKSWEVGIEMAMFKSRLTFDVTYYNQKTSDLIFAVQVGPETGYSNQFLNAGEMENKGIEAMVNIIPIRSKEFEWGLSFNFAKNENKLLSLTEGIQNLVLTNAPFNAQLVAAVGEKYGQIRGTDFVYDDQGNKVVGANGLYLSSDAKNLGSILPDYNLGIRNSISYKGFSLSALLDIQKGGKFFSVSNLFGMYSGMLEETAANGVRENGVVSQGVTGNVTKNSDGTYTVTNTSQNTKSVAAKSYFYHYYSGPAAQNVFDADYFKLREVTLSYTFPEKFRGPFANIVVTAFGRNLATWGLDNKNFDPEMSTAGSGNIQGFEGGSLPSTRSFGMNLKLQF